ncbi:hypothetical protein GCM10022407_21810 [Hymenobacter antarcticus]|uniref:Uncharacterized protein n=1 Tax=Hymenobacter antarcticus TaxID=486270 RepID=A0ABP7Q6H5_9BACT
MMGWRVVLKQDVVAALGEGERARQLRVANAFPRFAVIAGNRFTKSKQPPAMKRSG